MNVSCQCGAIKFLTPLKKPIAVYICHCDDCRRQSSSAFGASAIFPAFEIPLVKLMGLWIRKSSTGPMHCYFCKTCGTRLIHAQAGKETMSIKAGCIQDLNWESAKHIWASKAVLPLHEAANAFPGEPSKTDGFTFATVKIGESVQEKSVKIPTSEAEVAEVEKNLTEDKTLVEDEALAEDKNGFSEERENEKKKKRRRSVLRDLFGGKEKV